MGMMGAANVSSGLFACAGSFFETTREEPAEAFLVVFCALLLFFARVCLFAFFNADVIDFYSRSTDVARITRRNRYEYIQSFDNLTKDTMFIV